MPRLHRSALAAATATSIRANQTSRILPFLFCRRCDSQRTAGRAATRVAAPSIVKSATQRHPHSSARAQRSRAAAARVAAPPHVRPVAISLAETKDEKAIQICPALRRPACRRVLCRRPDRGRGRRAGRPHQGARAELGTQHRGHRSAGGTGGRTRAVGSPRGGAGAGRTGRRVGAGGLARRSSTRHRGAAAGRQPDRRHDGQGFERDGCRGARLHRRRRGLVVGAGPAARARLQCRQSGHLPHAADRRTRQVIDRVGGRVKHGRRRARPRAHTTRLHVQRRGDALGRALSLALRAVEHRLPPRRQPADLDLAARCHRIRGPWRPGSCAFGRVVAHGQVAPGRRPPEL